MNKIYGIDWGNKETSIVTCGQDRFVKFWDLNNPRMCTSAILTNSPVWRARFTPFGEGVITMPQRKDTHLSLWSAHDVTDPIHTFSGHTDIPREFAWRNRGDGVYQLVTWRYSHNGLTR
jgi:WD40 repeat protein